MELLIPLFILFMFILQIFLTKATKKQRELPSSEEETGDIFETLGFPKPPVPKPKRIEPEIVKPHVPEEIILFEETKKSPAVLPEEAKKEPYLSRETLEEGIILSIILGPPKAKEILPRWWNWHARGSQKPVTVRS